MRSHRRTFLIGGVAFAAACKASETSPSAAPPPPPHRHPRRLGVALLGLGKYSTEQLAPALTTTRHCYLAGIVTGTPTKIPAWQSKHAVPDENVYSYETLPEIANNPSIDVVYIVTPTSLHAKYAIMAARAGKHVWCEKPMAMTVPECQSMIAACEQAGVELSIGYRLQHEPNTQTVMQWATERPYGKILSVKALAGYPGKGERGWRLQREMGGGALYDMGVYSIQGLRYASGEEPVRVAWAKQSTTRPEIFEEVDETTEFELEFASGLRAYGRTSVGEDINSLDVECENGAYRLAPMQQYSGVRGTTSDGKALDQTIDNQQARQMDDDALAILEDRQVMVGGMEGLRDIRIVHAIRESALTGRPTSIAG